MRTHHTLPRVSGKSGAYLSVGFVMNHAHAASRIDRANKKILLQVKRAPKWGCLKYVSTIPVIIGIGYHTVGSDEICSPKVPVREGRIYVVGHSSSFRIDGLNRQEQRWPLGIRRTLRNLLAKPSKRGKSRLAIGGYAGPPKSPPTHCQGKPSRKI